MDDLLLGLGKFIKSEQRKRSRKEGPGAIMILKQPDVTDSTFESVIGLEVKKRRVLPGQKYKNATKHKSATGVLSAHEDVFSAIENSKNRTLLENAKHSAPRTDVGKETRDKHADGSPALQTRVQDTLQCTATSDEEEATSLTDQEDDNMLIIHALAPRIKVTSCYDADMSLKRARACEYIMESARAGRMKYCMSERQRVRSAYPLPLFDDGTGGAPNEWMCSTRSAAQALSYASANAGDLATLVSRAKVEVLKSQQDLDRKGTASSVFGEHLRRSGLINFSPGGDGGLGGAAALESFARTVCSSIRRVDDQWVTRFRPLSYDDVVGNKESRAAFLKWLKARTSPTGAKNVSVCCFIHGPPGSGKKCAVEVCARAVGYKVVYCQEEDMRTFDRLKEWLHVTMCSHTQRDTGIGTVVVVDTMSIAESGSVHAAKMDEDVHQTREDFAHGSDTDSVDASQRSDRAKRVTAEDIGRMLERMSAESNPVVIVQNDTESRAVRVVTQMCNALVVEFGRLHTAECEMLATRVCSAIGMDTVDRDIRSELASTCAGDARKLVCEAQMWYAMRSARSRQTKCGALGVCRANSDESVMYSSGGVFNAARHLLNGDLHRPEDARHVMNAHQHAGEVFAYNAMLRVAKRSGVTQSTDDAFVDACEIAGHLSDIDMLGGLCSSGSINMQSKSSYRDIGVQLAAYYVPKNYHLKEQSTDMLKYPSELLSTSRQYKLHLQRSASVLQRVFGTHSVTDTRELMEICSLKRKAAYRAGTFVWDIDQTVKLVQAEDDAEQGSHCGQQKEGEGQKGALSLQAPQAPTSMRMISFAREASLRDPASRSETMQSVREKVQQFNVCEGWGMYAMRYGVRDANAIRSVSLVMDDFETYTSKHVKSEDAGAAGDTTVVSLYEYDDIYKLDAQGMTVAQKRRRNSGSKLTLFKHRDIHTPSTAKLTSVHSHHHSGLGRGKPRIGFATATKGRSVALRKT